MDAPFTWEAGQFVRITKPDSEVERCYSISSIQPPLRLAVKRVPGGQLSNWLNDHLKSGDILEVSSPAGAFTLRPGERPVVLIAGGSGITPILSLAQEAMKAGRVVHLFYASRSPEEEIYRAQVDALSHSPVFHLQRHYDSEHGLPTQHHLASYADMEADFYLCGPGPLLALSERALEHQDRVFVERFVGKARTTVDVLEPTQAPATFSLWLDGRCRTVPYVRGRTLLQCATDAGLKPRSSCESGFCGSCMARVRQGDVLMRSSEALTMNDKMGGMALLCQSIPATHGPLEVDADNTSFRLSKRQGLKPGHARFAFAAAVIIMAVGTAILRLT